ncbi:LOW QUALITY PROTEIN: hypothetical protein U9M48_040421 [Paspalum notatum var. saurae]|uniref:Myb/SANT-like domain-containing protein n=1 Tax=Paspalum notatum var. saurae TaxID=547442 RepID=A0AAQ3XE63_PASNO
MTDTVVDGAAGDVPEVEEVQAAAASLGGNGRPAMRWTSVMSGFVLRRFVDLGVKTDKGFKEVHLNAVAKQLSEFSGLNVTGTQVYNHLRKWRQRWQKVCKLKDLSGALWDEDNYMIKLEEERLLGHTKDHPKDAEFLNTPIENYMPMQIIFGSGQATGRFAMGSNEPLGTPTDLGQTENETQTETINLCGDDDNNNQTNVGSKSVDGPKHSDEKGKGAGSSTGKKRKITEEEGAFMTAMTTAVQNVADALTTPVHNEMPPGLYNAVMLVPGFTDEALMFALRHLLDNKALGLCFVEMSDPHRVLWLRTCGGTADLIRAKYTCHH